MRPMLTVHHLENSRSHRILWLLEELEVDYEITEYQRDPDTQLAPESLRRIHPLGKSPVITYEGRTVAESGAIVEYLLDTFGPAGLRPEPGTDDYLQYRYWLHYSEGSAMTPFFLKLVFDQLAEQSPLLAKPLMSAIGKGVSWQFIDPEIEKHLEFWDGELAQRDYFAGDAFTAADILMSFPLAAALQPGVGGGEYARLERLHQRITDRPAHGRAVQRGGGVSMDF